MTDRPRPDPDEPGGLERALAAARLRRVELRAELESLERVIADLEQRVRGPVESPTVRGPAPTQAGSAWDRAVQAMRRPPGRSRAAADLVGTHAAPGRARRAADAGSAPRPVVLAAAQRAQATSNVPVAPAPAPVPSDAAPAVRPSPPAREPRPAGTGPSFLHALESDERLAPNQREALRSIYLRFVPVPAPSGDAPPIPADAALDQDPALGRGQREALRTMLDRFLHKAP